LFLSAKPDDASNGYFFATFFCFYRYIMTGDYLKHVRSMEELHGLIEQDPEAGTREAMAQLVEDVKTIAGKITADAKKLVDEINALAMQSGEALSEEAANTVSRTQKNATKAAEHLLNLAHSPEEKKDAALAAGRILEQAEKSGTDIINQATVSLARIAAETDDAAERIRQVAEDASSELAKAGDEAVLKLIAVSKEATARFQESEDTTGSDEKIHKEIRTAAAKIIRTLAEAADEVNRVAEEGSQQLSKTADEAISSVKRTAEEATAAVEQAIDRANEKILGAAEEAVLELAGPDEVEFFDLEPLRKKWKHRE